MVEKKEFEQSLDWLMQGVVNAQVLVKAGKLHQATKVLITVNVMLEEYIHMYNVDILLCEGSREIN